MLEDNNDFYYDSDYFENKLMRNIMASMHKMKWDTMMMK